MEKHRTDYTESCRVDIPDDGGDTVTLYRAHNGLLVNRYVHRVNFDNIKAIPIRDDDIIICSYPRSGVHWLWEQTRMLVEGKLEVDNLQEKNMGTLAYYFTGDIEASPSPRILNTHYRFRYLPTQLLEKRTKVILMYRNPKDLAVSFYNFHKGLPIYEYNGKFSNFMRLFQEGALDWGSYANYLNDWATVIEEHPEMPVHIMNYETLQKNNVEELERLSGFLGKSYDRSFLQQIIDKCTIDKQRVRKETYWQGFDTTNTVVDVIYRKGRAGGWKDWFTVAQSEQFDDYWSKAFKESKLFNIIY